MKYTIADWHYGKPSDKIEGVVEEPDGTFSIEIVDIHEFSKKHGAVMIFQNVTDRWFIFVNSSGSYRGFDQR